MSFPRHAKYKDSGVEWLGQIPIHWDVLRLKHACEVFPSNVDKHARDDEPPVLLCNYTDVYYNERITADMTFMAATASADQIARITLKGGDTIITKDSETADDIAIAAYVPEDLPGVVCGYHLSMVRPRASTCGAYVKRLFDSFYAKARFAVAANGLTRVGLGQYALDNVELPFPPPEEQRAIATFLDGETAKIDTLVEEQRRLIELLKEKRQAVISQAVTKGLNPNVPMKDSGVKWLGKVPAHWRLKRIKQLVNCFEQGWSPQCADYPVESDQEWGVLKVGCVNGGTFRQDENKTLPSSLEPQPGLSLLAGDLLISRANTRDLVGGAAVVDRDYANLLLCDKLYRLRFDRACTSRFIGLYLGTSGVRGQIELAATGASSSMLNIGQSTILELNVALPDLEEQQAITAYVDQICSQLDALTVEAESATALLQERRSALISAAVTGKIDVRGLVPQPEAVAA